MSRSLPAPSDCGTCGGSGYMRVRGQGESGALKPCDQAPCVAKRRERERSIRESQDRIDAGYVMYSSFDEGYQ